MGHRHQRLWIKSYWIQFPILGSQAIIECCPLEVHVEVREEEGWAAAVSQGPVETAAGDGHKDRLSLYTLPPGLWSWAQWEEGRGRGTGWYSAQ